jgi:serine/threonine-protein kinase RsbW/stage II sporulation protein AB (anti-sigma F factor)
MAGVPDHRRAPVVTHGDSVTGERVSIENGRWEQQALALTESIGVLRAGVVAFAVRHGVDAGLHDDIALAASEALTDSMMHAVVGGSSGTLRVVAQMVDDGLMVCVIDDGRGMIARTDSPGMGLGLPIMASVTSDLEIRCTTDGPGTEVRLSFAAGGLASATARMTPRVQ